MLKIRFFNNGAPKEVFSRMIIFHGLEVSIGDLKSELDPWDNRFPSD
jgi:hypothetical protein